MLIPLNFVKKKFPYIVRLAKSFSAINWAIIGASPPNKPITARVRQAVGEVAELRVSGEVGLVSQLAHLKDQLGVLTVIAQHISKLSALTEELDGNQEKKE